MESTQFFFIFGVYAKLGMLKCTGLLKNEYLPNSYRKVKIMITFQETFLFWIIKIKWSSISFIIRSLKMNFTHQELRNVVNSLGEGDGNILLAQRMSNKNTQMQYCRKVLHLKN